MLDLSLILHCTIYSTNEDVGFLSLSLHKTCENIFSHCNRSNLEVRLTYTCNLYSIKYGAFILNNYTDFPFITFIYH